MPALTMADSELVALHSFWASREAELSEVMLDGIVRNFLAICLKSDLKRMKKWVFLTHKFAD